MSRASDAGGRCGSSTSFGGGGAAPRDGAAGRPPFGAAGASTSRNTRLDVLPLPFPSAGAAGADAGGMLTRAVEERRCRSAPYILRCSSSMPRNFSLSGERSVNSFNAANACWMRPVFCMRSAYSTKCCCASARKPFDAYNFASFR